MSRSSIGRIAGSQPAERGSIPLRDTWKVEVCVWGVLVARLLAKQEEAVRFRSDALF